MQKVLNALMQQLFPPLCINCKEDTLDLKRPLCPACLELLSMIEFEERCKRCFVPLSECTGCTNSSFQGLAAAFEYRGPAKALMGQFKYSNRPHLAKAIAAFMVMAWHKLNWPFPDLIVPVPISPLRRLDRGYHQSFLLAQEISRMLEGRIGDVLKRRSGDFSQMGLDRRQRKELSKGSFQWKVPIDVSDQILLVVDDVMTTRTTLQHCASRLQEGFPKEVYGLSFCVAD